MEREEVIRHFLSSDIMRKWHFFQWHFKFYSKGVEHPLVTSIVDAVTDIESVSKGAGISYVGKIASINGRPKETSHFDQLIQVLAELLVVRHASNYPWSDFKNIKYEPVSKTSQKNPELVIEKNDVRIGIEVKAPRYVDYSNNRASMSHQISSRSPLIEVMDKASTLRPRDNPVKDFLLSADQKFQGFKAQDKGFIGALVIIWDDFIYEPISALSSPQCGLLTENSFGKDKSGNILRFPNVDLIVLTRHLLPIVRGTRGEPLPDLCRHPLDYGRPGEFPFKVFLKNPWVKSEIHKELFDCFQAIEPGPHLGAEYLTSDIITWFNQ